jgi:hypothetical protein
MQTQPTTFRFPLRFVFIWTVFVGLGLLALKRPFPVVLVTVNSAVVLVVVYAIAEIFASAGSRRLFWVSFAAAAVTMLIAKSSILPERFVAMLWELIHPGAERFDLRNPFVADFHMAAFDEIVRGLYMIAVSTAAGYVIPWIVLARSPRI